MQHIIIACENFDTIIGGVCTFDIYQALAMKPCAILVLFIYHHKGHYGITHITLQQALDSQAASTDK